jgi:hypothetical protein
MGAPEGRSFSRMIQAPSKIVEKMRIGSIYIVKNNTK